MLRKISQWQHDNRLSIRPSTAHPGELRAPASAGHVCPPRPSSPSSPIRCAGMSRTERKVGGTAANRAGHACSLARWREILKQASRRPHLSGWCGDETVTGEQTSYSTCHYLDDLQRTHHDGWNLPLYHFKLSSEIDDVMRVQFSVHHDHPIVHTLLCPSRGMPRRIHGPLGG